MASMNFNSKLKEIARKAKSESKRAKKLARHAAKRKSITTPKLD